MPTTTPAKSSSNKQTPLLSLPKVVKTEVELSAGTCCQGSRILDTSIPNGGTKFLVRNDIPLNRLKMSMS